MAAEVPPPIDYAGPPEPPSRWSRRLRREAMQLLCVATVFAVVTLFAFLGVWPFGGGGQRERSLMLGIWSGFIAGVCLRGAATRFAKSRER